MVSSSCGQSVLGVFGGVGRPTAAKDESKRLAGCVAGMAPLPGQMPGAYPIMLPVGAYPGGCFALSAVRSSFDVIAMRTERLLTLRRWHANPWHGTAHGSGAHVCTLFYANSLRQHGLRKPC